MIIADPGREHEAAIRLGRIGFDHIVGYLKDGLHSLEATAGSDGDDRARQRAAGGRAPGRRRRWRSTCARRASGRRSRCAGSVGIPLNQLAERAKELPKDRPLIVYCAGGYRSSIAASLLQQQGFTQVSEIAGGLAAWETAKLPITPAPAAAPH